MVKKSDMVCRCVPRRPRKAKRPGRPRRQPLPGVGVITPMITRTPPVPPSTLQAPVRAAAQEAAVQTEITAEGGRQVIARLPRRTASDVADERARAGAKASGFQVE